MVGDKCGAPNNCLLKALVEWPKTLSPESYTFFSFSHPGLRESQWPLAILRHRPLYMYASFYLPFTQRVTYLCSVLYLFFFS